MVNENRLINDFFELVSIDASPKNERAVADRVTEKLRNLALTVYEDDTAGAIQGNCGNLVTRLTTKAGGIPLFFAAHLDRVKPGNSIVPVVEGRRISSSGNTILGADDIVAVAAILEVIRVLKEDVICHAPLEFIFTVAEELGLLGSRYLDMSSVKAQFGYILDGEGPIGTITNQGPTKYIIHARIKGRASHAAIDPENGISAIKVASEAIAAMHLGKIDAETTANIGTIRGGEAINIVPELIELSGESRSLDVAKAEKQTEHMCAMIETAATRYGAKAEISIEKSYDGFLVHKDESVVLLAQKAAANAGITAQLNVSVGGSDANIFNAKGKRALNMGVAFNKIHSSDENILIDDLVLLTEYMLNIIKTASAL